MRERGAGGIRARAQEAVRERAAGHGAGGTRPARGRPSLHPGLRGDGPRLAQPRAGGAGGRADRARRAGRVRRLGLVLLPHEADIQRRRSLRKWHATDVRPRLPRVHRSCLTGPGRPGLIEMSPESVEGSAMRDLPVIQHRLLFGRGGGARRRIRGDDPEDAREAINELVSCDLLLLVAIVVRWRRRGPPPRRPRAADAGSPASRIRSALHGFRAHLDQVRPTRPRQARSVHPGQPRGRDVRGVPLPQRPPPLDVRCGGKRTNPAVALDLLAVTMSTPSGAAAGLRQSRPVA